MKNFLNIPGKEALSPPDIISRDLFNRFQDPLNIEWSKRGELYEAIFYCKSIEHIADYRSDGAFVSYRVNISPPVLPDGFEQMLDSDFEIMNLVKRVSCEGLVSYEIVARDRELNRYLININGADGTVKTENL